MRRRPRGARLGCKMANAQARLVGPPDSSKGEGESSEDCSDTQQGRALQQHVRAEGKTEGHTKGRRKGTRTEQAN